MLGFFQNHFRFEWNAATKTDWPKIKLLFVNAYVRAYEGCNAVELGLGPGANVRKYFEEEFEAERQKILAPQCGPFKINYLVVRWDDQPVGFIVTQLNCKTGRIYVRWNTTLVGKLGLGSLMLQAIQRYCDNPRVELYTRNANKAAIGFYQKNRMRKAHIDCDSSETPSAGLLQANLKRWLTDPQFRSAIYPPADEQPKDKTPFVALLKLR